MPVVSRDNHIGMIESLGAYEISELMTCACPGQTIAGVMAA